MARKDEGSTSKGVDRWKETETPAGRAAARATKEPRARRYSFTLLALALIVVASAVCFWPPAERITQGLDIRGGVSVILSASTSDGAAPSAEDMAAATSIVQNRVNALGAAETSVQQQGTNSILVQIPGATNADEAVKTIGQTGHLEFVRMDTVGDADALALINAGVENVELKEGTYTAFMDGSYIESSSIGQSSALATGDYAVNIKLNAEGTKIFAEVTEELAKTNGQIAIVLDRKVNSAPAVQEAITGGEVSITGSFSLEQANALKTVLDSGSLPVTLKYSESRVVGPTLGQDSLKQGVIALAIGAAIVVVYLFFFYKGLGLLTMGSLAIFGAIYLGMLALLSRFGAFALTLPGLAGVVLTTGSAADSSILVLERFREELRMGRSIKQAATSGSKHGIITSLDADAVTFVTAIALFLLAAGAVKGFGLTLMLGVACDVLTMFLFKAPLLRLLALKAIPAHPGFWGVKTDLEEGEQAKQAKLAKKGGGLNA